MPESVRDFALRVLRIGARNAPSPATAGADSARWPTGKCYLPERLQHVPVPLSPRRRTPLNETWKLWQRNLLRSSTRGGLCAQARIRGILEAHRPAGHTERTTQPNNSTRALLQLSVRNFFHLGRMDKGGYQDTKVVPGHPEACGRGNY